MGSLHDIVTWYKIHHAGWQKNATASKTERCPPTKRDLSLFWMPQCVACHPAGKILFQLHAKGPLFLKKVLRNVREITPTLKLKSFNHQWYLRSQSSFTQQKGSGIMFRNEATPKCNQRGSQLFFFNFFLSHAFKNLHKSLVITHLK